MAAAVGQPLRCRGGVGRRTYSVTVIGRAELAGLCSKFGVIASVLPPLDALHPIVPSFLVREAGCEETSNFSFPRVVQNASGRAASLFDDCA